MENDRTFAVINSSTCGGNCRNGQIEISLLHMLIYAVHPIMKRELSVAEAMTILTWENVHLITD